MISGLKYYGYVDKLKKMGKTIQDFFDNPQYLTRDHMALLLTWNIFDIIDNKVTEIYLYLCLSKVYEIRIQSRNTAKRY